MFGSTLFIPSIPLNQKKQPQAALKQSERPAKLGELEISVTPRILLTRSIVQQFADLGVQQLIVMPPTRLSVSQLEDFVTRMGESVIA